MGRKAAVWWNSAKGTYYVKVNGRQVRLSPNRREAEQEFYALMAKRDAPALGEQNSCQAVFELYLDRVQEDSPASYVLCRRRLQSFSDRHPGLRVCDLRAAHVQEWLKGYPGWADATRRVAVSWVVAAFSWAAKPENKVIPTNPLRGLSRPPMRSRGESAVMGEAVRERLREASGPALREFLFALHQTGTRPVNLCRVTAANVDLANRVIILERHKAAKRTGKVLRIPVTPPLAELLARLMAKYPEGPLFRTERGVPWRSKYLSEAVARAREKAGLVKGEAYAYMFRHTAATEMLEAGLPEAHVAEILGCTTEMLQEHYGHLSRYTGPLAAALDAVVNRRGGGPPPAAGGGAAAG
jgi:integrase